MIVLKFGGTSAGSSAAIQNLGKIVNQVYTEGQKPYVVCSAVAGVTNCLQQAAELAVSGQSFSHLLKELENRHYSLVRDLLPVAQQNPVLMAIKSLLNEVEDLLMGITALEELSPRSKARILAYGELLSVQLIAAFLNTAAVPALITDARKLVVTNSQFGGAAVNNPETHKRIESWQARLNGHVPVITGFIAANEKGETTILGRGGSDYTAAIFAAALKASEIQIWTDVDGFLTADPRLVKNAFSLPELSYREAMELCYFGAKIIHPPALIPAVREQIPIWVKNTLNPSHTGTLIHSASNASGHLIRGISSVEKICLINIEGNGMIGMKGFSGRLFGALARAGVNVILITQASSEHSISLAIPPDDEAIARETIVNEFIHELASGQIDPPQLDSNYSILAVVGENMRQTFGLSGKLFSALGKSGINLVAIAQGSSELNISVVIEQRQLQKALNAVHDALLLSPLKTINVLCVGTGTIGSELLSQIASAEANLATNHHLQINVIGICNSRKMLISDGEGLELQSWQTLLENEGIPTNLNEFTDKAARFNLPNLVLIDNTSSNEVVAYYKHLFLQNISVVTCNKLGNSGSYRQYQEFKQLAQKNGVNFYYETNVGAGLPIIKTLNDLWMSGDELLKLEAVLSGTLSYLFNEYRGEKTFSESLKQAQQLGYTEPDPRHDLNGMDFARKLLILAREIGLPVELEQVKVKGILPQSCIDAPSVEAFYEELALNEAHFSAFKNQAANENKKLCFIGKLENGTIELGLELVGPVHPFYALNGSDNIISFTTARYAKNPLVIKGPGAGAAVTAAGVFADVLRTN